MTITTVSAQERDQFKQNAVLRELSDNLGRFMNAEVSVAAASTTNIGTTRSVIINVTGSTGITAFDQAKPGTWRILRFSSNPVITYNSVSLITPLASSITATTNASCLVYSLGTAQWRIVAWWPPAG